MYLLSPSKKLIGALSSGFSLGRPGGGERLVRALPPPLPNATGHAKWILHHEAVCRPVEQEAVGVT